MGRRALIPVGFDKAREQASKNLKTLLSRFDVAEFRAQMHASDMVDVLAGFAMDPTQAPAFRRDCAKDVLERAYGTVGQKTGIEVHDVTPEAANPVMALIESHQRTAAQLQRLDAYVGKVPVEEWPEDIKAAGKEFISAWAETDGQTAGGLVQEAQTGSQAAAG
jgi:hypothetical protein